MSRESRTALSLSVVVLLALTSFAGLTHGLTHDHVSQDVHQAHDHGANRDQDHDSQEESCETCLHQLPLASYGQSPASSVKGRSEESPVGDQTGCKAFRIDESDPARGPPIPKSDSTVLTPSRQG